MVNEYRELSSALGVSSHGAKIYLTALKQGQGTLTELARFAGLSRTIMQKPVKELLETGVFTKRLIGKRIIYQPINPQQLPSIIEKKKQTLVDLSSILLQQISASEQDLQIRWFSGVAGIQVALREFFNKGTGPFRHFENAETYDKVGEKFADELVRIRVKRGISTRVVVITDNIMGDWYKKHIMNDREELRESITLSSNNYPFKANVGAAEDEVIIFEYAEKPFALLIENKTFAQSVRSIHKMVWERYQSR